MGKRVGRKVEIQCPSNHHPLVKWTFNEIFQQMAVDDNFYIRSVAKKAGVAHNTINNWSRGAMPSIAGLDAVLHALGYELVIREKREHAE